MPAARLMTPLAMREAKAAELLDMSVADFRRLVQAGALPKPTTIGHLTRWRTDDLRAILDKSAALPDRNEDIDL